MSDTVSRKTLLQLLDAEREACARLVDCTYAADLYEMKKLTNLAQQIRERKGRLLAVDTESLQLS